MSKIYISPSILSADFANLERDIKLVENNGADWIHVDVMDGHFVPNITIGIPVVKSLRKVTDLPLDVHLMIENPEKYIEDFAAAGADIITFHYEAVNCKNNSMQNFCHSELYKAKRRGTSRLSLYAQGRSHQADSESSKILQEQETIKKIIHQIKSLGVKAGLSIKPKTSPKEILPYLNDLDLLLVMTVEPGFGGQKFMPDCADKIPTIKANAPENLIIQVDGGINDVTGKICTKNGATSLVAGNYIYKSDDIKKAIESLKG